MVNARVRFITFMMLRFAGIALGLIGVYGAFACASNNGGRRSASASRSVRHLAM